MMFSYPYTPAGVSFAALLTLGLGACQSSPSDETPFVREIPGIGARDGILSVGKAPASASYPLDDFLKMNDFQSEATHNSYHIESWVQFVSEWDYTHQELDIQLNDQGVRSVELDIHYNGAADLMEVFHVPILDGGTTCRLFTDCMDTIKTWSDANFNHHVLMVLIEPKEASSPTSPEDFVATLESEISSIWPRDRIVTPDDVQGGYASLSEAVQADNWPTMGEARGKIMFIFHNAEDLRDAYTYGGTSLEGRLMFVESDPHQPFAATLIRNDPFEQFDQIQYEVSEGFMVRTRADTDGEEADNNDYSRFEAALESGAHWISTDYPAPIEGTDYYIQIPGGTPSRCNPFTSPAECTSDDIENPSTL